MPDQSESADRYTIPSRCLEGCAVEFWTEAEEDTHYRLTGHRIGWPIDNAAFDEDHPDGGYDEAQHGR